PDQTRHAAAAAAGRRDHDSTDLHCACDCRRSRRRTSVTNSFRTLLFLAAGIVFVTAGLGAQEKPPIVPLKVQIVISRYQGEKRVSSLPFTLAVNTNLNKT